MLLTPVARNDYTVRCVRCNATTPPKCGELFHPKGYQPYVVCAVCALYEGVQPPDYFGGIVSTFPRKDEFDPSVELAPYPYQAADAEAIAQMRSVLVNSEMGTGKTPTFLLSLDPRYGVLIFVPSSVKWNWKREGERWRPDLKFMVVANKRAWRLPDPGEVLICSYGMLPGDSCPSCRKSGLSSCSHEQVNPMPEVTERIVLAADEIHYLQRQNQRRAKWDALRDRVWAAGGFLRGLTGTSVSNTPQDLWEILECLNLAWRAFDNNDVFRRIFYEWFERKKGERSPPTGYAQQMMLERLRPVRICRLRKHVLKHLPPVQERQINVELSRKTMLEVEDACQRLLATRRAWEDVREGLVECPWGHYRAGKRTREKLEAEEKERRQALFNDRVRYYYETKPWDTPEAMKEAVKECLESRHETPAITELSRIRSMLAMSKITTARELMELHEGRGEPLIVFCQHIGVLEELMSGREGWGIYTGRVPQKKRDELYQAFQRGELRHGMGVSITAGAEGINLTRAGHMLFIDRHFNPAKNNQARDRLNRPGAEKHDSITTYYLEANHAVDYLLRVTLDEKSALYQAIEDDEWSQRGLVA